MTGLTRWVLAHKRVVVVFWVALAPVGMAWVGSASTALKQKLSVPGAEGWITNQEIARDFNGTGGNGAPLLAMVTLPRGRSEDLPAVKSQLLGVQVLLVPAVVSLFGRWNGWLPHMPARRLGDETIAIAKAGARARARARVLVMSLFPSEPLRRAA